MGWLCFEFKKHAPEMTQFPSRSSRLIAAMHHAALTAMAAAPNGQLQKQALMQAIEINVTLDDWARTVYDNGNTRWRSIFAFASVGLVKGGYVTKSRGVWGITDVGRAVVNAPYDGPVFLAEVNRRYRAWKRSQLTAQTSATAQENEEEEDGEDLLAGFPEERMTNILRQANEALSAELLEKIKAESPAFFERLVVQLLVAMGYGGNRVNAGQVTQLSADNGIDGIINEDPLGLDTIYLQAKRWQDPVGEGPVRDFIGALVIKGVKKGVFLTTSYFTPSARAAVLGNKSDQKIVLIDGARLAALMIEHNLGVSVAQNFALKRLDSDFFGEE
jgi:restriction system protein